MYIYSHMRSYKCIRDENEVLVAMVRNSMWILIFETNGLNWSDCVNQNFFYNNEYYIYYKVDVCWIHCLHIDFLVNVGKEH